MITDPTDFHRSRRRGPVHISVVAEESLALIWERLCAHRIAAGQPLPPDHLRPLSAAALSTNQPKEH